MNDSESQASSNSWNETVDVLVVGTGNGGLTSAICNYEMGATNVLVLEKTDKVGGTSATSGGGIWIPCNRYAKAAGADDSLAEAQQYLDTTLAGEDVPRERVESYLEQGPKMLDFLHNRTRVRYESLEHYPDYYSSYEGAKHGHRSLEPEPFMASELGPDYKRMTYSHHMMRMFGVIHFTQVEAQVLMLQLPGWIKIMMSMVLNYVIDIPWRLKTKISRRLCCGAAGIGRLYASLRDRDIPIWFNSALVDLIEENGRVVGAVVEREGKMIRIKAEKGVVVASGGFERNQAMREEYLPAPTNADWSAGVAANTGAAITAGMKLGAKTRMMSGAWWCTTLCVPDEEAPRLAVMEKSFPGSCVVNMSGKRFANESQNYLAYQRELFKVHSDENSCAPSYQVFDARFRRNYLVGPLMTQAMKPDWTIPKKWFDTGFVAKANTISELAEKLGIDAAGLEETIGKMNQYAKTGVDEDFQRGDNEYDRYYADPSIKPNPCLAAIDEAPFYAMRMEAGDFGTHGGLDTTNDGQVLRDEGVIPGLYAVGNCSAAILSTYPGPGATLGPAMTMAYQSAKHITGHSGE